MRKKFIGGNWKMNGSLASATALLTGLCETVSADEQVRVAVFPSDVYLSKMSEILKGSAICLGGQNHCNHEQGAFTGETAPAMLKDFNCEYVLLGHSERRHIFAETDLMVAQKFALARKNNLTPVLCVGETEAQYEADKTEAIVKQQIDAVIEENSVSALKDCVIAYEPVWAIGTGKVATAETVQEVHAMIRAHLASLDEAVAESVAIIYGGSLKPNNAAEIFALPDVDGGLIGGASLKVEDFSQLVSLL
jgi:triosephosphate isomerase